MESTPKVKRPQELTPLTEIDLRILAEVRDERDTFLSIYINTNIRDDRPFAVARLKEMVGSVLAEQPVKGEKGRMILASALLGFLEEMRYNRLRRGSIKSFLSQSEEISRSGKDIDIDSRALAERLKEAVLRGEPTTYGLFEVRKAL